jgi:hypothetical protein
MTNQILMVTMIYNDLIFLSYQTQVKLLNTHWRTAHTHTTRYLIYMSSSLRQSQSQKN